MFLFISIAASNNAQAKNESKDATPLEIEINITGNDIKIIQRASEILAKQSAWNRTDDRNCQEEAKVFSLYCALYKASVEINGEFDHRLAALEEVRRTVEDASKNKTYEHRLMGYNNDPATSFEDIKRILSKTKKRLLARLRK